MNRKVLQPKNNVGTKQQRQEQMAPKLSYFCFWTMKTLYVYVCVCV